MSWAGAMSNAVDSVTATATDGARRQNSRAHASRRRQTDSITNYTATIAIEDAIKETNNSGVGDSSSASAPATAPAQKSGKIVAVT